MVAAHGVGPNQQILSINISKTGVFKPYIALFAPRNFDIGPK